MFMDKRVYTFLIFPGAHGRVRRVSIPPYAVHGILAFIVISLTTMVALGTSYARMLLKVSDYNNVRAEREALKTQYRSLENTVSQTNAKLDSLQSLATEVALAYGFGEARRTKFPRIGTGSCGPDQSRLLIRDIMHRFMPSICSSRPV